MRTAESWVSVVSPAAHLGVEGELERQILRVQKDAYLAGLLDGLKKASEIANNYLQSMGTKNGMRIANHILRDILSEMERVKTITPNATP